MARLPDNQADHPFVAVLVKSGKAYRAEAAFGEEKSVYVGRKWLGGARAGDLVLIGERGRGRGEVERRLGRADSLTDLMTGVMEYQRVPRGFSRQALEEAEAARDAKDASDTGRRDLTGLVSFTIDPDEARDYDDAVSLEDGPGGDEVTLYVHIADVSRFVAAGSALDREARKKAVSVYTPVAVEPMLPAALSNDICSLRPGGKRRCVTVELTYRMPGTAGEMAEGEMDGHQTPPPGSAPPAPAVDLVRRRFYRSTIRSRARLTYNQVDDFIAEEDGPAAEDGVVEEDGAGREGIGGGGGPVTGRDRKVDQADMPKGRDAVMDVEVAERLRRCRLLAAALKRARMERGALAIETMEPEFRLSDDGEVMGVKPSTASESHSLIEEFMIAANEAVASFLEKKGAPCIYRVHEEPDPASVEALMDLMEDLGIATPPFSLEEGSARRAGEAVRELLSSGPPGTFFNEINKPGTGHATSQGAFFNETVLRALKQAHYLEDNLGHFGLASRAYLHFTSPIRRYPDIIVHRSLLAVLGLDEWRASRLELSDIALESSTSERRAAKVEHTGDDIVLAHLLDRLLYREGWDRRFEGEVISLIPAGLFLRFEGVYEGFVPARRLRGDYYLLNDKGSALVGRRSGRPYRLGDSMTVRVVRIDRIRGKVELEPAR